MDDAEALIERSHSAWAQFVAGDPNPALQLFSHREDVTIGNPFGPFVRGWDSVSGTVERAVTHYREGKLVGSERVVSYVSHDLACFVEVERYRAKVGESDKMSDVGLRVSTVVRREDNGWRIVSRHADPITDARPAESVIELGSGQLP